MEIILLMKLKYNLIFSLQLLILFALTCLTGYSQSTQMKFMGFKMGMRSSEVVGKLTSNDEITAYANDDHLLTRNDRIELFKNTDTLTPYHENRYKFNCPSYLLGTPNPINYHGYQEFTHFELKKLIFNEFEIKNPSFVFETDILVGTTGNINMLYSDYNELITGLNKKYGNGVYNNYLTKWMKDGNVITLYAPIYEQWKRNKKIKVHDFQYKSTNTIFYQFYNLDKVRECESRNNNKYADQVKKFITLQDKKISLFGLSTGMNKDQFLQIIIEQYSEVKIACGDCSNGMVISEKNKYIDSYTPDGFPVVDEGKNLPDSFLFDIPFKTYRINLFVAFYKSKINTIRVHAEPNIANRKLDRSLYDQMIIFYNAHKSSIKRSVYSKGGLYKDYMTYGINDDSLYLGHTNNCGMWGECTWYTLQNIAIDKEKADSELSHILYEIKYLLASLKNGKLLNFTIGVPLEYNQAQPIPSDYRKQWINISQNRGSYTTYEYDVSYRNERIITDGTLGELKGDESYCCYADIIQLYIREGKICSISSGIRPLFYNTGQQLQKVKADILKEMIKQLSSKYGEAIERSYAGRKSLYWIIDTYIFELILESKQSLYSTGSFNESFAVFFSFRVKDDDDLILKSSSKKGILD